MRAHTQRMRAHTPLHVSLDLCVLLALGVSLNICLLLAYLSPDTSSPLYKAEDMSLLLEYSYISLLLVYLSADTTDLILLLHVRPHSTRYVR